VLDPASHALTSYLNGARVGQATNVAVNAAQVINQTSGDANRLFIGRSQNDADATLNARVHDVRIYRIALTGQQVATIRNNASSGRQSGGARGAPAGAVISTAAISKDSPLASQLERVPDIKAETIVGQIPRLQHTIPAVYRNKAMRTVPVLAVSL
jgi:hypothetical protein